MATPEQATTVAPSMPPPKTYVFLEDYLARGNGKTKTFVKGETVVGFYKQPPPNVRMIPTVQVEDYLIPLQVIKEVPKVDVKPDDKLIGQTKQIIKTTNFKQGATLGAILGAGYGFFNNKSVFFSALVGMMSGGVLGHFLFKPKDKKPTTTTATAQK